MTYGSPQKKKKKLNDLIEKMDDIGHVLISIYKQKGKVWIYHLFVN